MANVTVTIQPADLDAFLRTWAQPLLRPAAEQVKAKQEALAPRDTHSATHIADGIAIVYDDQHADIGPRAEFFYARALEVGGATNRAPRPFIRPSAT